MDFTAEKVAQQWHILNYSNSIPDKKDADNYLRNFKKSQHALEISIQIYQSQDIKSKTFACLMIYQIIKEKSNELLESKEQFTNIKNAIFSQIIPTLQNSPEIIEERICYSITILLVIGLYSFWQEGIEDVINFGKGSNYNCLLCTIILSNCSNELTGLPISDKLSFMIRDKLIDKAPIIREYISFILGNFASTFVEQKIKEKLYLKIIDLTKAWITFEINVLSIPHMTKMFIDDLNKSNVKVVSNLFMDSIQFAKSSKIESTHEVNKIEDFMPKTHPDEMISLKYIIEVIIKHIQHMTSNNNKIDYDLLNGLANIFCSISENFIFLFFVKDDLSKQLFELLFFFISVKKRFISDKFFESIDNMKEFINKDYKFSNYSNEEKVQFSDYLLKITEALIANCRFKTLPLLSEINATNNNTINSNVNDDDVYDSNEISVEDYRQQCEDVFFNIFTIFAFNFKDDGINYFFDKIIKLLSLNQIDINDNSLLSNQNHLVIIEAILFSIKSIVEAFLAFPALNSQPLIQFTSFIMKSKAIENDSLLKSFLLFLEQTSICIPKNANVYFEIINFLLNVILYKKHLSQLASEMIFNITSSCKHYYSQIFDILYQVYINHYDSLSSKTLHNLAESLCVSVAVVDDDGVFGHGVSFDLLIQLFSNIMQEATNRIGLVVKMLKENNEENIKSNFDKIKNEIVKNYTIHQHVLKHAFLTDNSYFLNSVFLKHFNDTYEYTCFIFNIFSQNDSLIIHSITQIYIKVSQKITSFSNNETIFDNLSNLMINTFKSNPNNYYAIYVIKNLFANYLAEHANSPNAKTNNIVLTFFDLLFLIHKNITTMQITNQIEQLETFARFFSNIYTNINISAVLTTTNQEHTNTIVNVITNSISLLTEALQSIIENNLINNILKCFMTFMSYSPKEILQLKLNDIIFAVFSAIDHYNSYTIKQLNLFVVNCLKIDCNSFLEIMKKCFSDIKELQRFEPKYVDIITQYLQLAIKQENEKGIKNILNDIICITQGMGQFDTFNHYAIELARYQITQKHKG